MIRHAFFAAVIALGAAPLTLAGQSLPRVWLTLSPATGASSGDGEVYQGSLIIGGRAGAGLAIARRLGFEASAEVIRGWGRGDYACVGGMPCPASFDLTGASGSFILHAGPDHQMSSLRIALGAGAFHVTNDYPYFDGLATATALSLHAGAEATIMRLGRSDLALGVRPTAVVGANGATVWVLPFTLTLRLGR